MSMQSDWIDFVFERLSLTYGRDFLDRYLGLDPQALKDDWARELAPCTAMPDVARVISWALSNLPSGKPPTAVEFRRLCASAPQRAVRLLPGPKPDAQKALQALANAKAAAQRAAGNRDAAQRLAERAQAGEVSLTQAQREWLRAVQARRQPQGDEA